MSRFLWPGNWPGLRVEKLYAEYLLPVCSPLLLTGEKPLKTPEDLAKHTLLHDASRRDWQAYTRQLGLNHINVQQGPIFSHSAMVLQAAIHGQGSRWRIMLWRSRKLKPGDWCVHLTMFW